jgi:hypothetical protein
MQPYEIRILFKDRGYSLIEMLHLNDYTAIRAAEALAAGRPFEVWRDLECIHGLSPAPPQMLHFKGAAMH